MIGVREMIVVRKINSERPMVAEKWCDEQVEDFHTMVESVDDLISTAMAAASSPHQYSMLQQAKEKFINDFLDMAERYRLVVSEKRTK